MLLVPPKHTTPLMQAAGNGSRLDDLFGAAPSAVELQGTRPAETLKRLRAELDKGDRAEWVKKARFAAVLGNCPKSRASFHSGTLHTGWQPAQFALLAFQA